MKNGIGPHDLGAPKGVGKMYKAAPNKKMTDPPTKTDKGFYTNSSNGKKPKGEMGSGFYIGGDGKRSHTPNFGGNNNVDPGFNTKPQGKIVKKVVKRKIQTPVTTVKPKPIPRIVK